MSLQVEVGDGEVDASSRVHGDGPDADGVVVVRVRVVGRHQRALVGGQLRTTR